MQLNWHILEMPTGYKSIRHLPSLLVYLASVQAYTFAPFFSFFVFFAMEILFLAPSNGIKNPKAKMKINAKKTNSTSENTIQSSYFVLELRKLYFFKEVNLEIEIFHPRNPFHTCCGVIRNQTNLIECEFMRSSYTNKQLRASYDFSIYLKIINSLR